MEAIVVRGCGLDVHQASVVACVLTGGLEQRPRKQVRRFGTTRRELMTLRAWLTEETKSGQPKTIAIASAMDTRKASIPSIWL